MKKFLIAISILTLVVVGSPAAKIYAQSTNTDPNCSAASIDNDSCYENQCTGQASEDSATCNAYATQSATADDGNTTCASITPDNESSCCGSSESPMCVAYENYTDGDAAAESGTAPQQVGGGAPTTNPLNSALSNISLGGNGASSAGSGSGQAVATCSAIQFTTLLNFAIWGKCIIGAVVIPGIFTLAFVVFLWGVFKFIRASEDKDKQEGKQFIYMGLIGLFVMLSVWGIITILTTTFGITAAVPLLQTDYLSTSKATTTTPTVPTSSGTGTSQ